MYTLNARQIQFAGHSQSKQVYYALVLGCHAKPYANAVFLSLGFI